MPTLFISYKRDDKVAVTKVSNRLHDEYYFEIWIDAVSIPGGEDWRAEIRKGIDKSDVVLLMLTPDSCASVQVKEEVDYAKSVGRKILPLQIKKVTSDDQNKLAVERLNYIDFVGSHDDRFAWEKLLNDLPKVSLHERRQRRDSSNPKYVLHQTYLKRLTEQIGTVNLAQINPEERQAVYLEDVYVDSPTGLNISVEVKDWEVIDWWIDVAKKLGNQADEKATIRYKHEDTIYERSSLETLINRVDNQILKYRQENPSLERDKKSGTWDNGIHTVINLYLKHLASANNHLVILGAPGSGKSTFVKYLALCLAGSGIIDWTRKASIAILENWPHGTLTPVYVELRRFVVSKYFPADVKTSVTADHLWAYIQHEILGDDLQGYAEDLRYDLEHGYAVLILDGLDEVPYPESKLKARQQQLIGLAQSINTRFANSRVIVSSRPYAYEGWKLPGFNMVAIAAFEDAQRVELARRLYITSGMNETTAQIKAQSLTNQLQDIDPELTDRPLFVTLMATIYLKSDTEGLPTRRGALYRESILLLLDRWTTSKTGTKSLAELLGEATTQDLYNRLAVLAYEVHSQYGNHPGTPEIPTMLLDAHLMKLGRQKGADAVKLFAYLSENTGVLISPGQDNEKDVFHFAHRTFQEYLAGAHLVSLCTEADSFMLISNLLTSNPDVWRMPCTLAGDVLADTERRGDLWNLMDDLLSEDIPEDITPNNPHWWKVWLASEILQQQKMLKVEKLRHSEKAVCDQLRKWTHRAIELGVLHPIERASCGRALGLLGDQRKGIGLTSEGLPDIDWVEIPSGEFIYQNEEKLELPAFKIARYPVTHIQFQAFVKAKDGYYHDRWWKGLAADETDRTIREQAFQYSNHPRNNVNWYQTIAFCRWLSNRLGYTIMLPTEEQWEKAAKGIDRRNYPYGNKFHASMGNSVATGIGMTSAVGIFPNGLSPYGIADMSGNVREWCLNKYESPRDMSLDGKDTRVLRGGCCNYFKITAFRCDSREGVNPDNWYYGNGFRICC